MTRGSCWRILLVACLAAVSTAGGEDASPGRPGLLPLVPPDLEHLEAAVADQLRETGELLASILADPAAEDAKLAGAFGDAGRLYHAYELLSPAAVCYANASRLAPREVRWIYYAAVLDQQAGRVEEAIAGLERALAIEPRGLAAWVRLAELYLESHRLDDARAALDKARGLDPASPAALAVLGQVELSQKRYGEAVEHLEAALAAVPAADRLHHPLGLAYRGLGDMEKAREHLALRGKVGVKPPDPLIDSLAELAAGERVFLLRGQMAYRAGRFEEAADAFAAALAARPESVAARVDLGSALAGAGRRDEAIARFREVVELDPANAAARFNLGVLLAQAGDTAGAAESLQVAVDLTPGDVEARLELARALLRLGRPGPAGEAAARAARLDPASEDARLLEAQALISAGSYGPARERLEEAHALMPEAGRVAASLAKLLAASPDLAQRDGLRAVELALSVYRATGDVLHAETVAMALAEAGRCDEAERWQRRNLDAARQAGADALAASLAATLEVLARRPCRMPVNG